MDTKHVPGETLDIKNMNIQNLKTLFPEVFTEGKIDFDKLKQLLGEYVDDSTERYNFTWNGKGQSLRFSQSTSTGTLRPCPEESKDWDTTNNLYIEGDNLEVLKLLQKSYFGKVKMIYIDPPYNTGGDFIYPDDFKDSIENYKTITGQVDRDGMSICTNTESNGRYHTDWLNMIYPRIRLARNLLKDDGVICVSISDDELFNLKKVMDELFGEENYINTISVRAAVSAGASGGGEDKRLKKNIEFIVIYAKQLSLFNTLTHLYFRQPLMKVIGEMEEEGQSWKYTSILLGADERVKKSTIKDGEGNDIDIYLRKNVRRTTINKICKEQGITEEKAYAQYFNNIFSDTNAQSSIRARVIDEIGNLNSDELLEVEYVPRSGASKGQLVTHHYISNTVRRVIWLKDTAEQKEDGIDKLEKVGTYWDGFDYNNVGKEGNTPFPNGKKPINLLKMCLELCKVKDGLVLDFFSGSSSFAHAVIDSNIFNNANHNFIMVQLPENLDLLLKTAGTNKKQIEEAIEFLDNIGRPHFITEIGKERIRRAGDKIKQENPDAKNLDIGFKVLKLDTSNIKRWNPDTANLETTLEGSVSNWIPGRTDLDVVYEILIKLGLPLDIKIEQITSNGKTIYTTGSGALIVSLADGIDLGIAKKIIEIKENDKPETCKIVFRDNGFKTDSDKTNVLETLRAAGMEEILSI